MISFRVMKRSFTMSEGHFRHNATMISDSPDAGIHLLLNFQLKNGQSKWTEEIQKKVTQKLIILG